ncbi:uncharacterized protein LOC117647532 [Thrips palmi]|uniref:Uncharacterized protein LOC117647532 n=1 Tax=Thrips palmi TaxID=161013 RepID=A0A6P8ZQ42_THRPL|nr:uncharacterized protein LOC117647532 [Thrips palmi]
MAEAAGPVRRASRGHRAKLAAPSLHAVLLLLAAAACLVSCGGVDVDDKGAELPPRRFPSGPNLDKLRLHVNETGPPPTPSSQASPARATAATAATAVNHTVVVGVAPPAATARPFLEPTKSAAVLVGVFVSVALVGYFSLLVWRRVLERRYGNREILVNEEQFEQDRDLRNFQL